MGTTVFQTTLNLQHPPISVTFCDEIPKGISRIEQRPPAGCTFWKLATTKVFYATPEDHFGCPIGATVHGLSLPTDEAQRLDEMGTMMTQLGYLRSESLSQLPRLQRPWAAILYAPLDQAPQPPDVVIVMATARPMMLLLEAVEAASLPVLPVSGRPACHMIPTVHHSNQCATNLGCIGNRVYTQLADNEFYLAFPGRFADSIAEKLSVIRHANEQLEKFHCGRRQPVPA